MRYRLWLSTIIAFCLLVVLIVRSRYDKPTETFVRPRIAEIPVPPAIEDEGQVITTSTAGPFQTLVLFVQEDGQNYEPAETIQVARPSVMGSHDDDGWRLPNEGEKLVKASRRTLYQKRGVQIRETIIESCDLPVRVLERIYTDRKGKRRIDRQEMAPNQVIVKFRDRQREKASLSKLNAKIIRRFVGETAVVKLPKGMTIEHALVALHRGNAVQYAEPDWVLKASVVPNDTRFEEMWGLDNVGQSGGTTDADIDAPEAWDISTGSTDVIVAVIDTGVDYTHPDLAPNMWVNAPEMNGTPGVDDDGNGYVDDIYGYDFANGDGNPMDDHFHGTHCAGTIGAAGNNSRGVVGVCWNVRIMALKFLTASGSGYTSDAIGCVNYARENGAKILSNSWGGGGYSQSMVDAISVANDAGILFVAAAGNDNSDNNQAPTYPANYDVPNIISVASTNHLDEKSWFSNWGETTVDLAAPGSNILSTFPTEITSAMAINGLPTDYAVISGTSMATPHVSGALGLLLSNDPTLTSVQAKERLLNTTDSIPSMAGKCLTEGRLNVDNMLRGVISPIIYAVIDSPIHDAPSARQVNIMGIAGCIDFTHFTVEAGEGEEPAVWSTTGVSLSNGGTTPVQSGKLASWLCPATSEGVWSVRLTVTGASGSKTVTRQLQIDPYLKAGFPLYAYRSAGTYLGGPNQIYVTVADLTGDGKMEIIGSTLANGGLHVWDHTGDYLPGWPRGSQGGAQQPVAGPIDPSGEMVIGATCYGGYDWGLLGKDGTYLTGWPKSESDPLSLYILMNGLGAPTIADVDGDGHGEFIVSRTMGGGVDVFTSDGKILAGWPEIVINRPPFTTAMQRGYSISVGDVDQDGFNEVFAMEKGYASNDSYVKNIYGWNHDGSVMVGWPVSLEVGEPDYTCVNGMALGDVDGDGSLEVIVTTSGKIHVLDAMGASKPGWPYVFPPGDSYTYVGAPVLGDLDGDSIPEIVVNFESSIPGSSTTSVYALKGNAAVLPGFPVTSFGGYDICNISPVIGDIDGDGKMDIFTGFRANDSLGDDTVLLCLKADGTIFPGWPKTKPLGYGSVPAISDIDGDGKNDVVILSTLWRGKNELAPFVFAWDFNSAGLGTALVEWGQHHRNPAHTGLYPSSGYSIRPGARSQSVSTNVNEAVPITLEGYDAEGSPLTYSIVDFPQNGTLSGNLPNPTYTPDTDYRGIDTFTFRVNDGTWDSLPATVTITVNNVPVAVAQSVVTDEDVPLPITLTGTDANSDPLTYEIVRPPMYGELSGSAETRTYNPNPDFHGIDSFTFRVNDGLAGSLAATVTIGVNSVNDAPVTSDLSFWTPMNTSIEVELVATDVEGHVLTYTVGTPTNGNLTGTPPNLQYHPNASFLGQDSFSYTVNDGTEDSNVATVTITVTAAPVALDQSVQTDEDINLQITLVATDANNDPLTYQIIQAPQHGTLSGTGSNQTYNPDQDFNGVDSFTFRASDGYEDSDDATVQIAVTPVNDAPVAVGEAYETLNGEPIITANLLSNDYDVDRDTLVMSDYQHPANGIIDLLGNNSFAYTPNGGFVGVDHFEYTVSDGNGGSSTAIAHFCIGAPGEWPTMGNGSSHNSYVPLNLGFEYPQKAWTLQASGQALPQVAVGAGLVFVDQGGTLACRSILNGRKIWSRSCLSNSPMTYENQTVYTMGNVGNGLKCLSLNAFDGNQIWEAPYVIQFDDQYAPITSGGHVYMQGGMYGGMYCFDKSDGGQNFFIALEQTDEWTPAYHNDRLFSWVNGNFREHNPQSGLELWKLTFPGQYYTYTMETVPAFYAGRAFVIDGDYLGGKLHAIDLNTKLEIWNADGPYDASPAVDGAAVYAIRGNTVEALDIGTGELICTYQGDSPLIWQPIVTDNCLLVSSSTKTFIFKKGRVEPIHTLEVGGPISLAGRRLFVAGSDGYLSCYLFNDATPPAAPIANDLTISVYENEGTDLVLTASDANYDAISYVIISSPANGLLTGTAPNVAYTPNPGFVGQDAFTFKVTANGEDSNVATVTITVTPSLVAHYTFDEGANRWKDGSTYANHGSGVDTPSIVNGQSGKAMELNGTNYVSVADADCLDIPNRVTVMAWIWVNDATGDQNLLQKGSNYALFEIRNGGTPKNVLNIGGVWKTYAFTALASYFVGSWHHVAITYDGETVKNYLDGVTDGTFPQTGAMTVNGDPIAIGANAPWYDAKFKGKIDDVRIYRRALSAGEIGQIVGVNSPPVIVSEAWADPATIQLPATTTVAIVAEDPDNDPLTYTWSKVSGLGDVSFTPNGTDAAHTATASFTLSGTYVLEVSVSDGTASITSQVTVTVLPAAATSVIATHIFYNNSDWDDNDPAAGIADDLAIATDKAPLLPGGGQAVFANYTSYLKGINGIMIDVDGTVPDPLPAGNLTFKVVDAYTPTLIWKDAPLPTTVKVRAIDGGSRITVIWADGAIKNTWLQVTVNSLGATDLVPPHVFYYGNAVAETGNSASDTAVDVYDMLGARNNVTEAGGADVENTFDFNRDKAVDVYDMLGARNNVTDSGTELNLITPP